MPRHAIRVLVLRLTAGDVDSPLRIVRHLLGTPMEVPIRVFSSRIERIPQRDAVLIRRRLKINRRENQRTLPLIPLHITSHARGDQNPINVILVGDALGRLPPGEPFVGDAKLRRCCYFPAELLVAGEPFTKAPTNC